MSPAAVQIAKLIPKLSPADRRAVRQRLDEADSKTWREDSTKFRQLMRGKTPAPVRRRARVPADA